VAGIVTYTLLGLFVLLVPPKSRHRLRAVAIMGIFTFWTFHKVDPSQVSTFHVNNFCSQIGIFLYSNFFLYLNPQSPLATTTFLEKLVWVLSLVSNPRGIGTSWKIKRIPPFTRRDPKSIPSRRTFIITRSLNCISFLVLFRAFSYMDGYYWSFVIHDGYTPELESILRRLHQVAMSEFLNRLYLPLQFILLAYTSLSAYHCLLSVVVVLCGDEPSNWPPAFGSPADAYTLRRCWGHFWQQFYRRAF
jgi:hypothetical protein